MEWFKTEGWREDIFKVHRGLPYLHPFLRLHLQPHHHPSWFLRFPCASFLLLRASCVRLHRVLPSSSFQLHEGVRRFQQHGIWLHQRNRWWGHYRRWYQTWLARDRNRWLQNLCRCRDHHREHILGYQFQDGSTKKEEQLLKSVKFKNHFWKLTFPL